MNESVEVLSPFIIGVVIFLIQQRIFVTPQELEKTHREILDEVRAYFAPISSVLDLKQEFSEIKDKIDLIYKCIISQGVNLKERG